MPQPFYNAVLTDNGADLLTKLLGGELQVEFTGLVVGCGVYSEQEKSVSELQKRAGLKSPKNRYVFSDVSVHDAHSVKLTALITNQDPVTKTVLVEEGYHINEIGIYAKEKGKADASEVLYSISVTSGVVGDYMPAYDGYSPAQITQDVFAVVGNSGDVFINSIGAALLKDGDASDAIVNFSDPENRENISSGERLSVLFGKIKRFFADLKTVAFTGSYTDLDDQPTLEDFKLEKVGNYKAVSTEASQGLTDPEKANARNNINAIGAEVEDGYCGIVNPAGTNALWIRMPPSGLLPAQSGTNCSIGSTGWHFKNAYIDYVTMINAICTGPIQFKGSKSTNNMIRFLDNTADAYGNGISISGGGMTIVGGGESASSCENLIDNPGIEELWLTSDGMIHFYTNCNTIANKAGVALDNSRNFYPEGPATTYAGSLGTSTNKWLSVYTQGLNGTTINTNGQASTSGKGVVQLSDSTGSTSTTLAATANAVKKAMDGKSFSHLDKSGTATMSVSSVFSTAKEIIVHVYATDANSNKAMYTWSVAPGAIGTGGVHLLSGYQSGSYGGLAEVTLTRDTAKIEHVIVSNTELAAKATMRISYR